MRSCLNASLIFSCCFCRFVAFICLSCYVPYNDCLYNTSRFIFWAEQLLILIYFTNTTISLFFRVPSSYSTIFIIYFNRILSSRHTKCLNYCELSNSTSFYKHLNFLNARDVFSTVIQIAELCYSIIHIFIIVRLCCALYNFFFLLAVSTPWIFWTIVLRSFCLYIRTMSVTSAFNFIH